MLTSCSFCYFLLATFLLATFLLALLIALLIAIRRLLFVDCSLKSLFTLRTGLAPDPSILTPVRIDNPILPMRDLTLRIRRALP